MSKITFGVTRKKGNKLRLLAQQIHKLDGQYVEVGHFKEQGNHSSGFSYPELMAIHHTGSNPSGNSPVPPRPVLDILAFRNRRLDDPIFKKAFTDWSKRTLSSKSNDILLTDIGKALRDKEYDIFGSSDLKANAVPPKKSNNPLVETGELRSKVAFKTSTSKTPKEK